MNMKYPLYKQQGLTLIELMVALVISLLILAGLFTVYQSNNRAYRISDGLVRVQENGRFALDFIVRELRMAGFPAIDSNLRNQVGGTEGTGPNNSDTLIIRNNTGNDCIGTAVAGVVQNTYTIVDTGRTNKQGNAIMALDCNGTELVEGIENLQVLYGVDTDAERDGIPNRYVDADNVAVVSNGWQRVVTVRIALLANSGEELATVSSARSFRMLGTNLGPYNDSLIRREYISTVLLNNYLYDY